MLAAETSRGRKNAVRKIDRAQVEARCWTRTAMASPITICSTTISTASRAVTPKECTTAVSAARRAKFASPTNSGGEMMSQEKKDRTKVNTIGAAVNTRIVAAEREIIAHPKAPS